MYLHIYAECAVINNYYLYNFTRLISCRKFTKKYESRVGALKYFRGLPNPTLYK